MPSASQPTLPQTGEVGAVVEAVGAILLGLGITTVSRRKDD